MSALRSNVGSHASCDSLSHNVWQAWRLDRWKLGVVEGGKPGCVGISWTQVDLLERGTYRSEWNRFSLRSSWMKNLDYLYINVYKMFLNCPHSHVHKAQSVQKSCPQYQGRSTQQRRSLWQHWLPIAWRKKKKNHSITKRQGKLLTKILLHLSGQTPLPFQQSWSFQLWPAWPCRSCWRPSPAADWSDSPLHKTHTRHHPGPQKKKSFNQAFNHFQILINFLNWPFHYVDCCVGTVRQESTQTLLAILEN